jgi:hypothetical protein
MFDAPARTALHFSSAIINLLSVLCDVALYAKGLDILNRVRATLAKGHNVIGGQLDLRLLPFASKATIVKLALQLLPLFLCIRAFSEPLRFAPAGMIETLLFWVLAVVLSGACPYLVTVLGTPFPEQLQSVFPMLCIPLAHVLRVKDAICTHILPLVLPVGFSPLEVLSFAAGLAGSFTAVAAAFLLGVLGEGLRSAARSAAFFLYTVHGPGLLVRLVPVPRVVTATPGLLAAQSIAQEFA